MTNLRKGQRFKIDLLKIDMKHVIIALLMLLSAASFQARAHNSGAIGDVKQWNCGSLVYTPEIQADGSIIFTGCSEGQDLAFHFIPKPGKVDEYMITDGDPNEYVNPFWDSCQAKHIRKNGLNLICLYDDKGSLRDVLSPLEYPTGEEQAEQKWTRQLMGEYSSSYGEPLIIGDKGKMRFSSIDLTFGHITFNGMIIGVVEISGGTRLEGIWKVEITRDGLKFTKGEMNDYWQFQPTEGEEIFTWARKDIPRFDYASKVLLNDESCGMLDNQLLRLIRNEIWFHHGYVPSSPDLQEYLVDKEWYTPRASNDGILKEISLIELLNIERIKTIETQKELFQKGQAEVNK